MVMDRWPDRSGGGGVRAVATGWVLIIQVLWDGGRLAGFSTGFGVQGAVLGGAWGAVFIASTVQLMLGRGLCDIVFVVICIGTVVIVDVVAGFVFSRCKMGKAVVVLVAVDHVINGVR